jgi:hypothetical protein
MGELGGAWTGYTPTLGGSGWALGNGTIDGAYRLIGKRLVGRCYLQFGSTSTAGAGGLTFTLPTGTPVAEPQACTVAVYDDSAGDTFAASGFLPASTATITTSVDSTLITFATDDVIAVQFEIEVA